MDKYTAKQILFGSFLAPVALAILVGAIVMVKNAGFGIKAGPDAHIRGNINAPVKMVEYSDFQCPFCGRHYPTLKQILKDYGDKVSLEYKQFPLNTIHPYAQKAAEASECANDQNKFWEFHDLDFEHQADLNLAQLKVWAKNLNLNMNKFNTCLDTGKYTSKVAAQEAEGSKLGVNGTPATFINGQLVSGAQPYEALKAVIDNLLKK